MPSVQQDTEKRKKFIPSPDCFPTPMRDVLKAKQAGLPVPSTEPVVLSQTELFLNMKKKEKKKEKKKVIDFFCILS